MIRVRLALVALLVSCVSPGLTSAEDSQGKVVFDRWCDACHMDSPFAPGTIQLKQTRGREHAVIEKRNDLAGPLIRIMVRQGLAGMPKFRRTEISEAELDALVNYLENPR